MKLTIAIPTYNRANELKSLLGEIADQASGSGLVDIEVLVSDNASTDGTVPVVDEMRPRLAEAGVPLVYSRNAGNIGFSGNVIKAVNEAGGEFVLVMGDDDGFEKDALRFLLEVLRMHEEADVFFLGASVYDSGLKKSLSGRCGSSSDIVVYDGDGYLIAKKGYPPSLVSGYVFRKSAWRSCNADEFAYSMCVHLLAAAKMMLMGGRTVEVRKPCIKYRSGQTNSTWPSDPLYPFRFWLDILMGAKLLQGIAAPATHAVLCRVPLRSIAYLRIRQKITRHPFSRDGFLSYYAKARSRGNVYSLIISAVDVIHGSVLRFFFGRIFGAGD